MEVQLPLELQHIVDRQIVRVERIDGRLMLIQWMLAVLIGGVATLVVKAFA